MKNLHFAIICCLAIVGLSYTSSDYSDERSINYESTLPGTDYSFIGKFTEALDKENCFNQYLGESLEKGTSEHTGAIKPNSYYKVNYTFPDCIIKSVILHHTKTDGCTLYLDFEEELTTVQKKNFNNICVEVAKQLNLQKLKYTIKTDTIQVNETTFIGVYYYFEGFNFSSYKGKHIDISLATVTNAEDSRLYLNFCNTKRND